MNPNRYVGPLGGSFDGTIAHVIWSRLVSWTHSYQMSSASVAESVVGLYKTECARHEGPWRGVDDLELATLNWVHWFNETRLHSALGHVPPIEFEAAYYTAAAPDARGVTTW